MDDQIYSIGELSQLGGIPVRRLRFYSDKGLLPSARTESGYRMYSGADLARLTGERADPSAGQLLPRHALDTGACSAKATRMMSDFCV